MTPHEALDLLVNAARSARLTYAEHAATDRAAQLLLDRLKVEIAPASPPEPPAKPQAAFDHGKKS